MSEEEKTTSFERGFAKLFEHETYGQILVISGESDDGDPELRFLFRLSSGVRIENSLVFVNTTEEGWRKLDEVFDDMSLNDALAIVEPIIKDLD